MDGKINYAEVLIDGKVYTVGGTEDIGYLQKVAAYINFKLRELRSQPGFSKQSDDYQQLVLAVNMADDYFKAQDMAELLQRQKEETERDIYSIKHDLIHTQMKLEEAQVRIQELEAALHITPVSDHKDADKDKEEHEEELNVSEADTAEDEEEEKAGEVQETEVPKINEEEDLEEEKKRLAREEEEKQKALEAAKIATEQLLKSRPLQNRGRQTKR